MIDRELYLPEVLDRATRSGCAAAGVPDDIEFLTKPALATGMLIRALDAGVPAPVGGRRRGLRRRPRRCAPSWRPAGSATCWPSAATAASRPRPGCCAPTRSPPALPRTGLAAALRRAGAKGQRFYDWALDRPPRPRRRRRSGRRPVLVAAGPAPPPTPASWRSTAATAPSRCRCASWSASPDAAGRVEESFQAGKGLAGLDEHQVRRWTSWRRWTLLAMLAHALLAVHRRPRARRAARTRPG